MKRLLFLISVLLCTEPVLGAGQGSPAAVHTHAGPGHVKLNILGRRNSRQAGVEQQTSGRGGEETEQPARGQGSSGHSMPPEVGGSVPSRAGGNGKTFKPVARDEWPSYWHKANEAYKAGHYQKATKLYSILVRSGLVNGHLYYNLGNSLIRSGRLGKAVAAYLRSRKLIPRDQDVKANLKFARKSAKDAIDPIEPSAFLKTVFFWHYGLNFREVMIAAGIFSLLFWILMILRLFRRESEALKWVMGVSLALALAFAGSLVVRIISPTRLAVVSVPVVQVKSATSPKATVLFELHEGAEARMEGEEHGWVKISLADGKRGWVREKYMELVQ
ncbi:MAG: tetratricopeptide repeat protein [Deltaproteobacteria bacterium]|nr:tetratricopeptide repeat protein [Deltaproteobacteria bacterium]